MAAENAINKIIEEIKTIKAENKELFNTKIAELQEKIKVRDNEYDARFKKLDEQRDDYIKEQKELMNQAIKEFKEAWKSKGAVETKHEHDVKTYGSDFGEFMCKVKKNDMELKALSENTGVDGGYLVPDVWSREVNKISLEESIFITNGAKQINIPTINFKMPSLKYNSNADGSQYGGVIAYWADEATDMTALSSKPEFEYIEFTANKLIGYSESSEELIEDSIIAIGPFLQQCFAEVLAFKEDVSYLRGDGVGKPLGVLTAACRVTVSRATASQIHPIDLVGMIARFKGNLSKAVWLTNQTSLPQLYTLQDNNGNFIFINNYNTNIQNNRTVGSLFGIPVKVTEKAPALGSEGDIGLYDMSQYVIANKSGLRVEESRDFLFGTDKRCWKLVKRVDGRPWMKSAITPYEGSDTLSPYAILI